MAIIKRKGEIKPDSGSESDTSTAPKVTGQYIDKIVKDGVEYEIHAANGGEITKAKEFLSWGLIEVRDGGYNGFAYRGKEDSMPVTIVFQWYKALFKNKRKTFSHGVWKGKRTFGTYSRNRFLMQNIMYNERNLNDESDYTREDTDIAYKVIKNFLDEDNMEQICFGEPIWANTSTLKQMFDVENPIWGSFEYFDELKRINKKLTKQTFSGDEDYHNTQYYLVPVINMPEFSSSSVGLGRAGNNKIQTYNQLSVKIIKDCTVNPDGTDPKWIGGQWSSWSLYMKWKLLKDVNEEYWLVIAVSPQKVRTIAENDIFEPWYDLMGKRNRL